MLQVGEGRGRREKGRREGGRRGVKHALCCSFLPFSYAQGTCLLSFTHESLLLFRLLYFLFLITSQYTTASRCRRSTSIGPFQRAVVGLPIPKCRQSVTIKLENQRNEHGPYVSLLPPKQAAMGPLAFAEHHKSHFLARHNSVTQSMNRRRKTRPSGFQAMYVSISLLRDG